MMTAETYDYLTDLVRRQSSMSLNEDQAPWVRSRLEPLARSLGDASIDALARRMRYQGEGDLHRLVVQTVAINETSFFRDRTTFDELGSEVLPLAATGRPRGEPIRIWSAACASGQEPYSIAMVAHGLTGHAGWGHPVEVLATDFSVAMVERTRLARYSHLEVNRGLPARRMADSMVREGPHWRVRAEVRSMVTARQHNLATEPAPLAQADIVFLRNVLIYFDLDVRRQVLGMVRDVLAPGGFLVLGASETALNVHPAFTRGRDGAASWFRLDPAEVAR